MLYNSKSVCIVKTIIYNKKFPDLMIVNKRLNC